MKYILGSFLLVMAFVACQKEIGLDDGTDPNSVSAVFSLQGSPDSCTTARPSGYYAATSTLTDSNTVTIQVNVTTPGTYAIKTDTVNGYSFSDSGLFIIAGMQTVVLKGKGTPLLVKTDTFTPKSTASGSIGCSFKINVVAPTPAVFTYSGAPDTCTIATVEGAYAINIALTDSNKVTVQVNVTAIGSYRISTDTVAGMSFATSGIFSTTGTKTIILAGIGKPDSAGIKTFKIGPSGCTFKVPVLGPAAFTTGGAPGACTVATVSGLYSTLTPLSAMNTVSVQVNVTTAGAFTLTTNTVGGITFSKTGIFTTTGTQNVVLVGSGQPTTVGQNSFNVGTNGCGFKVTVYGPAAYTFSGSPNTCTVATVAGDYTSGIALNSGDSATIQVNVTTAGAYKITTDTVGGISFGAAGIFTATGVQTVVLRGVGTPSVAGANLFTLNVTGCKFTVTVAAPIGEDTLQVKVNDTLIEAETILPLTLSGTISITGYDSAGLRQLAISFPENIAPGSYSFNLSTNSVTYTFGSSNLYFPAINSGSLQILENNAVTKRVRGNFSFTGTNPVPPGSSLTFTQGYFSVEYP